MPQPGFRIKVANDLHLNRPRPVGDREYGFQIPAIDYSFLRQDAVEEKRSNETDVTSHDLVQPSVVGSLALIQRGFRIPTGARFLGSAHAGRAMERLRRICVAPDTRRPYCRASPTALAVAQVSLGVTS
jgi:hypothetical protein